MSKLPDQNTNQNKDHEPKDENKEIAIHSDITSSSQEQTIPFENDNEAENIESQERTISFENDNEVENIESQEQTIPFENDNEAENIESQEQTIPFENDNEAENLESQTHEHTVTGSNNEIEESCDQDQTLAAWDNQPITTGGNEDTYSEQTINTNNRNEEEFTQSDLLQSAEQTILDNKTVASYQENQEATAQTIIGNDSPTGNQGPENGKDDIATQQTMLSEEFFEGIGQGVTLSFEDNETSSEQFLLDT
jgi:hypothetical protein